MLAGWLAEKLRVVFRNGLFQCGTDFVVGLEHVEFETAGSQFDVIQIFSRWTDGKSEKWLVRL